MEGSLAISDISLEELLEPQSPFLSVPWLYHYDVCVATVLKKHGKTTMS